MKNVLNRNYNVTKAYLWIWFMTDNLSDDANSVSTAVIAEYSLVSEKIALQISPPTDLHRRKHDQRSKPHNIW